MEIHPFFSNRVSTSMLSNPLATLSHPATTGFCCKTKAWC